MTVEPLLIMPNPGSVEPWVIKLKNIKVDNAVKVVPSIILIKNNLILPYINIFINCNTIRLRYFEEKL